MASSKMCAVCFEILIAKLKRFDTDPIIYRFQQEEPLSSDCFPLFVTWNIGEDKDLRGCIGTFDRSNPIGTTVPRYALISALNDSRFPPITLPEIKHLSVSVSLLRNFIDIEDPLNWVVGVHGIEIEFKANGRNYSGTFLPEVAPEQGWDQANTLVYLFRKAGYKPNNPNRSPLEIVNELRQSLKVTTYESSKLSMTYQEYLKFIGDRDNS